MRRRTLRERERFEHLETAFAGLDRDEVVDLVKRSSFIWLMGKPATQSDKNSRMKLYEYTQREKVAGPDYKHRETGLDHAKMFFCVVSVQTADGTRKSAECTGTTKAQAAEAAAADLVASLNIQ